MKSSIQGFVKNIIDQTECSQEEKADMYEELIIHLEISRDELIAKGMSEREAEIKAVERFGSSESIGHELQQSIFPYRKELMLTLALMSFLYSIVVYLFSLFSDGDAHIGWLVVSMIVNSLVLFIPLNHVVPLNRRRWVNSLLITHILIYLYGYAIVSTFDSNVYITFAVFHWMIILLSLFLVYQTTIYKTNRQGELAKEKKRLHQVNFIAGIAIIGLSLFFLWGAFALFGGFHAFMILMFVPLALWIVLYFTQLKMLHRNKRISVILAIVSILIHVVLVIYFFFPFFIK